MGSLPLSSGKTPIVRPAEVRAMSAFLNAEPAYFRVSILYPPERKERMSEVAEFGDVVEDVVEHGIRGSRIGQTALNV